MYIDKTHPLLKRLRGGEYMWQELELYSDEAIDIELDNELIVPCAIVAKDGICIKNNIICKCIYSGEHIHINGNAKVCGDITANAGDISIKENLKVGGDIKSDMCIQVDGSIKCDGSIATNHMIEAGGAIEAGDYIKAGWYIQSGEHIRAGSSITSGRKIKAKTYICAEERIFAGTSPELSNQEAEVYKTIECAELRHGEICYGELKITAPPEQQAQVSEPSEDENSFLSV